PQIFNASGAPIAVSAIGNPYLFSGHRYDPETGFYEFRTRYLDPRAGRFTTRDVIGIWGDSGNFGNGYAYVGNNPWSLSDPLGLLDALAFAKGVGAGIPEGAWSFVEGIGTMLWNLVLHPIDTVNG